MKTYTVKVTCEYYVDDEAASEDDALEAAIDAEYELHHLQNFEYELDSVHDA